MPDSPTASSTSLRTVSSTVGWGLFLTSSWTWCIGMWLPIILLTRYGWPGFWVFAVPNVLGCAAMGYLVRSRESSQRMVTEQRGPMRWFSAATIAYQLFFLSLIFGNEGWLLGDARITLGSLVIPVIAFVLALLGSLLPERVWPWLGSAVFVASISTWPFLGPGAIELVSNTGAEPAQDLWPLAPLIILGFLACPWLDPTFHRARQLAPSRHAFGIFGVTFCAVLFFVTSYWSIKPPAPWPLVLAFFFYQATFTMAAHFREIRLLRGAREWGSAGLLSVLPVIGIGIGFVIWTTCCLAVAQEWLEDTYLRFLALYGLVFPTWILTFMLGRAQPNRRNIAIFVVGLLVCLPIAEAGMLHTAKWWLVPAVAVSLATAAVINATSVSRPRHSTS